MTTREHLKELLENASPQDVVMWGFTVLISPLLIVLALIGFGGACVVALAHHYVDGWMAWRTATAAKPCTHDHLEPWHDGHVHCLVCTAIVPGAVCPECFGPGQPCPKCHGVGLVVKVSP